MCVLYLSPDFDASDFLTKHWQQTPLVLRQLLPGFSDFLDEHDLAGLSEDDDVDSRIIQYLEQQWRVTSGPFDDFEPLCRGQWTLLVQGVDRYLDEASDLMRAFDFIPYWRMDDLMVSFANAGGSVGPHLDQYDVFLIQGKGQRHWRVGKPGHHKAIFPHPQLSQIAPFDACIDVVLNPGDVLYIPPGWPHEGIALNDCLTYSVGFRAPDQQALLNVLPDMLGESSSTRFSDPGRLPAAKPGVVSNAELVKLKDLLKRALDSDNCDEALLRFLSDQHLPDAIPDHMVDASEIEMLLAEGATLVPAPGCRPLYQPAAHMLTFYINGEKFACEQPFVDIMMQCIEGTPISAQMLNVASVEKNCTFFGLLANLINKGYWAIK